jgi:hypothetical protein
MFQTFPNQKSSKSNDDLKSRSSHLLHIPKSPATTAPIPEKQSESSSNDDEVDRDTLTDHELEAIKAADAIIENYPIDAAKETQRLEDNA